MEEVALFSLSEKTILLESLLRHFFTLRKKYTNHQHPFYNATLVKKELSRQKHLLASSCFCHYSDGGDDNDDGEERKWENAPASQLTTN